MTRRREFLAAAAGAVLVAPARAVAADRDPALLRELTPPRPPIAGVQSRCPG